MPVNISIVAYTNTLPFQYGIHHIFGDSSNEVSLTFDTPADCAKRLINGSADVGLVPVAALKQIPGYKIVSDYCLGSNGKVDSVNLYSEVPLAEINTIVLDYQSRTSVELVKVLCREYWKIQPHFEAAQAGFENEIRGNRAAVIIGDRTFSLEGKYRYEFDLAEAWNKMTGLPFVFAVWVSVKELAPAFLSKFEEALAFGNEHIETAIKGRNIPALSPAKALTYLRDRMNYELDAPKKEALVRFLEYISS